MPRMKKLLRRRPSVLVSTLERHSPAVRVTTSVILRFTKTLFPREGCGSARAGKLETAVAGLDE